MAVKYFPLFFFQQVEKLLSVNVPGPQRCWQLRELCLPRSISSSIVFNRHLRHSLLRVHEHEGLQGVEDAGWETGAASHQRSSLQLFHPTFKRRSYLLWHYHTHHTCSALSDGRRLCLVTSKCFQFWCRSMEADKCCVAIRSKIKDKIKQSVRCYDSCKCQAMSEVFLNAAGRRRAGNSSLRTLAYTINVAHVEILM